MSFVGEHRDRFGVEPILRVLDIPVSTFAGWVAQHRHPCQRRRDDQALTNRIRRIHHRSGQTDGAPRVHAQLRRDGIQVSRKRVARLLRTHGLQGAFLRKRWRCSTRQDPPRPRRPTWSTATSRPTRPTGCGSLTAPGSEPGRGRCGWPVSGMGSRGGSWAGRPATGPIPSWCWARWRTPSGAAAWTTTPASAGSSTTATGAPSPGSRGRRNTALLGR
jgi:HTH-like domain